MKSEVPVEYKKGFTRFLNCKINLRNRVFIPRIETEFWVRKAIKEIKKDLRFKNYELRILDIFAGSGCIGIAVLKNIENTFVDFVDIDKKAIEQIKFNLKLNKILKERYRVLKSNIFEKLAPYLICSGAGYDFIFANPPYVAAERLKEVEKSVLEYEPKRAILAGKRGLFYIRKFLKKAKNYLKERGTIFLEFDPFQRKNIEIILKKEGYKNFLFLRDQFNKYRLVKISKIK